MSYVLHDKNMYEEEQPSSCVAGLHKQVRREIEGFLYMVAQLDDTISKRDELKRMSL